MSRKFEKLIELIINEDEKAARALFHEIVVAKSRQIYESLESDVDGTSDIGGDEQDELASDVSSDFDDSDSELDTSDEFDTDVDAGEGDELEDRVVDLEDALDELKSEFARLMDDEPESDLGDADLGDDSDLDSDVDSDSDDFSPGSFGGGDDEDDDDLAIVREYVERVKAATNSEEGAVNKKSTVAGKNDMGGTINKLGGGTDEKGGKAPSPKDLIGKVQNTAGGSKNLSAAPKATNKEVGGTNSKSPLAKK